MPGCWVIPTAGEPFSAPASMGLTSDPEPGHPLTPWKPQLPSPTLLSAYAALASKILAWGSKRRRRTLVRFQILT